MRSPWVSRASLYRFLSLPFSVSLLGLLLTNARVVVFLVQLVFWQRRKAKESEKHCCWPHSRRCARWVTFTRLLAPPARCVFIKRQLVRLLFLTANRAFTLIR